MEPPVTQPEKSGKPKQLVTDVLSYHADTRSAPSEARIFLIAGGMDNANFAQEIVDQKRLWQEAGFSNADIACYYTIPLEAEFDKDEMQYRAIAADLKDCYPASPKLIWAHMEAAAAHPKDFVYIYVSSHGGEPPSVQMRDPRLGFPQKLGIARIINKIPDLNQYAISLDVMPDLSTSNLRARIIDMAQNNTAAQDHLFTPRYLKNALAKFGDSTPKYVSLQACHSGGFLDTDAEKLKLDEEQDDLTVASTLRGDTLPTLPTITTMAAARADRSSFGCDSGRDRTVFGDLYGRALADRLDDPRMIDWRGLFEEVEVGVQKAETELIEKRVPIRPSLPQYFSNQDS